eukprot:gene4762-5222_t
MSFSSSKLGLNRRPVAQPIGGSRSGNKVVPLSVTRFVLGSPTSKKSQVQPMVELRTPSFAD